MSFAHSRPGPCGGLHTQHQPLRAQPCRQASRCPARQIAVQAKKGVPDPPDTPKQERRGGREWMQTMLARFGPLAEKPENTAVLDFEKPLVELDNRIKEASDGLSLCARLITSFVDSCMHSPVASWHPLFVLFCPTGTKGGRGQRRGRVGSDKGAGGPRCSGIIISTRCQRPCFAITAPACVQFTPPSQRHLKRRTAPTIPDTNAQLAIRIITGSAWASSLHSMSVYDLVLHPRLQLRTDTYNRLTPVQQLHVARHPNRPTFLDIALNITDKFVELHGDRAGEHPPA